MEKSVELRAYLPTAILILIVAIVILGAIFPTQALDLFHRFLEGLAAVND